MGTILTRYGDAAYDHEGYAAQVLDDGSLTSAYSDDTIPRMLGRVVAACGCGWTGCTRYPATGPFDSAAEELALAEWEHTHARPILERLHAEKWDQLRALLRRLADSHSTATHAVLSDLLPAARRDLIEGTLAALEAATELARQLREPPTNGGAR